jgi:NAD(P)-dependent dehydrogenase (short-subunit alcohol dehydrogenase family)
VSETQRVALVTGAGSGIGQRTAMLTAERGTAVACLDLRGCDDTVSAIESAGGAALSLSGDITDVDAWPSILKTVRDWAGPPEWLANIAGIGSGIGTALEVSDEEWARSMNVNVRGTWLAMRAGLPAMIEQGYGRIVNVSSVVALRGSPGLFAYSASKGAIAAMTRAAAVDFASKGVRVNAVAPGTIETPILGDITSQERDELAANHLLGRIGQPLDVARVIHFLLSDESDFLTGQIVCPDGGWSAGP